LILLLDFDEWTVVPVPLDEVLAVVMVFVVIPIVVILVITVVDAVVVIVVAPVFLLMPVVLPRGRVTDRRRHCQGRGKTNGTE
jgi:hypothetical protein